MVRVHFQVGCVRNLELAFISKYLDEITPEMIRSFKEARIEQQLSPATINRDLSCLRQILGIASKSQRTAMRVRAGAPQAAD